MVNFSISWLNGISALLLVTTAWILVIICVYHFIKLKKSVYLGGILLFSSIGIGWLGITLSFLTIEFTGANQNWVEFIIPYFSYGTLPIGSFAITYIVWDLIGTKKTKKITLLIYLLLSIVYYAIFIMTLPFGIIEFSIGIDIVIDDWVNPKTLFYFTIWLITSITTLFSLIGFVKMRKEMIGELKTRSTLLLISTPIFALCILNDTVILGSLIHDHFSYLFIFRILMMISIILIMYAFRPTSNKPTLLTIPILIIVFVVFFFFIGLENGI